MVPHHDTSQDQHDFTIRKSLEISYNNLCDLSLDHMTFNSGLCFNMICGFLPSSSNDTLRRARSNTSDQMQMSEGSMPPWTYQTHIVTSIRPSRLCSIDILLVHVGATHCSPVVFCVCISSAYAL